MGLLSELQIKPIRLAVLKIPHTVCVELRALHSHMADESETYFPDADAAA